MKLFCLWIFNSLYFHKLFTAIVSEEKLCLWFRTAALFIRGFGRPAVVLLAQTGGPHAHGNVRNAAISSFAGKQKELLKRPARPTSHNKAAAPRSQSHCVDPVSPGHTINRSQWPVLNVPPVGRSVSNSEEKSLFHEAAVKCAAWVFSTDQQFTHQFIKHSDLIWGGSWCCCCVIVISDCTNI